MRALVRLILSAEGAEVYLAADGREGLGQFGVCRPDLVLLDIKMPVLDGWETCRLFRRLSEVPIVFLTAVSREDDIVRGLDCGAVGYITKPFSPKVLLARVQAVFRTVETASRRRRVARYDDGYLSIDLDTRRVSAGGNPVQLTATEYRLLAHLLENAGRVLTYDQILKNVWGWGCQDSMGYVHVYVWHLRQKLDQDPRRPRYVLNERGVGYRFEMQRLPARGQAA
jgi:two-component system KDP operon response regulator KdpE